MLALIKLIKVSLLSVGMHLMFYLFIGGFLNQVHLLILKIILLLGPIYFFILITSSKYLIPKPRTFYIFIKHF